LKGRLGVTGVELKGRAPFSRGWGKAEGGYLHVIQQGCLILLCLFQASLRVSEEVAHLVIGGASFMYLLL
jgi:hypothetical protein